jgi:ClpP class serine protease
VNRPRQPFVLDARALAIAGATCRPLALSAGILGTSFSSLRAASVAPRAALADDDHEPDASLAPGGVAIVSIDGPLAQRGTLELCAVVDGYNWVTARFADALDRGRAVVLQINSPGGDGAGLAEAVRRMRAMADAAGKPVLAYVDELAASAAYWIAAGVADQVFLPETGRAGSIGAIAVHVDVTGAAEKAGEKYTLIRDPAGKAAGSALEALDDTARERISRDVESLSSKFAAAIAERRGLSLGAVRALDADVLQGADAVRAGLADGVASFEQVLTKAAVMADEKENAMSLKAALAQMLKLPAGATDEQITASIHAAMPLLDLGRSVLAFTGASSSEGALTTLGQIKRDADASKDLRAELEAKKAKKSEKRKVAAITAMIGAGYHRPKLLKDPGGEICGENLAEPWAGMSVEMLEANAEALGGAVPFQKESKATTPATVANLPDGSPAVALTAEERHVADLLGLDVSALAQNKAREVAAVQRERRLSGDV